TGANVSARTIKKSFMHSAGSKRTRPPLPGCRNTDGRTAREIRRFVDAAAALVFRHLRERAERPAPIDLAVARMGREDRGRRLSLLAPLLERCPSVKTLPPF